MSSGEESDNGTGFGKQYRVIIRRTEEETGLEKNSRIVVVKNDAERREEDTGEREKRKNEKKGIAASFSLLPSTLPFMMSRWGR